MAYPLRQANKLNSVLNQPEVAPYPAPRLDQSSVTADRQPLILIFKEISLLQTQQENVDSAIYFYSTPLRQEALLNRQ